jgi:hypothetical protein
MWNVLNWKIARKLICAFKKHSFLTDIFYSGTGYAVIFASRCTRCDKKKFWMSENHNKDSLLKQKVKS